MDSVFQVMDSILSQWSLDSGFQSFVGFRSSVSCIPDSKAKDFVFHKQSFPGFRIPQTKTSRIWESGFPHIVFFLRYLATNSTRSLTQLFINVFNYLLLFLDKS